MNKIQHTITVSASVHPTGDGRFVVHADRTIYGPVDTVELANKLAMEVVHYHSEIISQIVANAVASRKFEADYPSTLTLTNADSEACAGAKVECSTL